MDLDPTATPTPATTWMLVPEPVPPTEWPALGAFIFRSNRTADGRVRCLHGDQGGDERSHMAELAELPAGEAAFWRAAGSRAVSALRSALSTSRGASDLGCLPI